MKFEWDEEKRKVNVQKHGLDFADAEEIFAVPMFAARDDRADYGEVRFVGIGFLRNIIVVVVYTEPDEETVRVISLRKALTHERERLEATLRDELGAG